MSDSTQIIDKVLLNKAEEEDYVNSYSEGKSVSYINDINQGSYQSGIVTLDTTSLLGSSKGLCSFSDAYLMVPYVFSLKGAANPATAFNRFSAGFKCNLGNILDRVQIDLNGKTLSSNQQYLNMWNNIRVLTEFSPSDVQKWGSTLQLYPDDVSSIGFSATANASGDGFYNNQTNTAATLTTTATASSIPGNKGFIQRLLNSTIATKASAAAVSPNSWPTLSSANASNSCIQLGKPQFQGGDTTAATSTSTWYTMIQIPLSCIHPIFKEINLISSPSLRLQMYFNTGYASVTSAGTSSPTLTVASVTTLCGSTCPVMLSSSLASSANNSGSATIFGAGAVTLEWGVLQNSNTNGVTYATASGQFPFSQVRLYAPTYRYKPEFLSVLASEPTKRIKYLDYFSQSFPAAAAARGSTFSLQLSANLKRVKYVALLPFATPTAGTTGVAAIAQYQNPVDSAPWTVLPGSGITNYNVQIANQWVYQNSYQYDFNNFYDEFTKINAIHGGLPYQAISNGLINSYQWSLSNRIMLTDLSRLSSDVPQALLITGQSLSDISQDFIVIVAYERHVDINTITGEVSNLD